MCLKLQTCVHGSFSKVFSKWGNFIARYPCLVLVLNLILLCYMSSAAFNPVKVDDESLVWTPRGNQSLKDREKREELYKSDTGFISMIGLAKYPNETANPNLLTRGSF